MSKRYLAATVLLMLVLAACASPTPAPTQAPAQPPTKAPEPTAVPQPTAVPEPTKVPLEVPFETQWVSSPHNDKTAVAFNDWNDADPKEVPASCATCHTTTGYQDFLGADGSTVGKVDKNQPIGQTIQCVACHNETASTLTEVAFPGKDPEGNPLVAHNVGDSGRCMVCHQGRASRASVDARIEQFKITDVDAVVAPIKDDKGNDVRFGFINIHYFAAAATLYGTEVKGGYEYEGKSYDAKNQHVTGYAECAACHSPHTLQVKVNECAVCHEGVKTVEDLKNVRMVSSNPDYDGDGDVKEGMAFEIEGLQAALLAEIQKYAKDKAGAGIVYDPATYPYFLLDANNDGAGDKNDKGAVVAYNKWTARLLKAAYNYQVSIKDPGAFAHGNKYIVQLVYDSIEDLGGDVSKLARTDAGHFAGDTLPFRDWDDTMTVPYRCAKCHSADGLPTFVKNSGTVVVDGRGNTLSAGIGAMPSSNGFMCTTCHNQEKFPELQAIASVTFPSGKSVSFAKDADGKLIADNANLCILCHQGRESTLSVNNALRGKEDDTADKAIGFKNIHYLGAGATLFGNDAQGAYQYTGKDYLGLNPHPVNKCTDCHDVHALKVDEAKCAACHSGAKLEEVRSPGDTTDYDGDGNTTEGTAGEVETMAEKLFAAIQAYAKDKAGAGIVYSSAAYPYFFLDADGDGKPDKNAQGANVSYNAWTPRLLRAAFNYQYVQKDPGAFVHNPKYVFQFLYDSIADLGGDVKGMTRPETPKVADVKPAAGGTSSAGGLVAARAAAAPKLDGVGDDAVWKDASAVKIDVAGGANMDKGTAELKSVYSGDMVYFLLTYADPTKSEQRAPWKLNADGTWAKLKDPNDKGGDNNVVYEDKFSMMWPIDNSVPNFEKVGCMAGCHVNDGTGKPYGNKYFEAAGAVVDLWHWKSIRNDGQIDDQYADTQVYDKEKFPEAGRHSDKNDGGGYKDNQTEDKKLPAFGQPDNKPAPPYFILDSEKVAFDATKYKAGDEVPGIVKSPFKGDRGDISAGWKYADGKWTIEFGRKLDTGSKTDVQFSDLKKTYYFGLALFDNAQVRHAFQTGATPFAFQP